MGSTHQNTWKQRERTIARLFGAERQPGSGGMGRADQTRSDSTHGDLFIETKLRAKQPVVGWFRETARLARSQLGMLPVLVLADGAGRTLWAIEPKDLPDLARGEKYQTRTKTQHSHAVMGLYDKTRVLAAREGKCPIVALCQKSSPGFVLVIDPTDLPRVAEAWAQNQARQSRLAELLDDET